MEHLGQGKILFSKNKTASLEIVKQILDKPLTQLNEKNTSPNTSFGNLTNSPAGNLTKNYDSKNSSLYKKQINLATCWQELAKRYSISDERAKIYGFCYLQTQFPRDKVASRILNNPDSSTFQAIVSELSEYMENDRILLLKLLTNSDHTAVPGITKHFLDNGFLEAKNDETMYVLKIILQENTEPGKLAAFNFFQNNMYSNQPDLPECLLTWLLSNREPTKSNFKQFLELQPMIIKNSRKLQAVGFIWAINISLWQKTSSEFQSSTNFQQILQNCVSHNPLRQVQPSKLVAEWLGFVLESVPMGADILEVQKV